MLDGQIGSLERIEVVAPVHVEGKGNLIAGLAVGVDLGGDAFVEQLSSGKAQRPIDEIILVINNYQQFLHARSLYALKTIRYLHASRQTSLAIRVPYSS